MSSAWGLAWSDNWNGAWGVTSGAPPVPPSPPAVGVPPKPSGGYPAYDRGPTKAQKRRSRILHGLEAEIVQSVAERQVEKLGLDEIQQRQELEGELRLRGIEMQALHLEALNARREALIDAEIARLLHLRMMEDDAATLMMIAAAL